MRHLRLQLDPGDVDVHPLVSLWTESDAVDRARYQHWNITDDRATIMILVDGDREQVVAVAEQSPQIVEFDVTPVDDDQFFLYVVDEATALAWKLFRLVTREGLIVVPPVIQDDTGITLELVGEHTDLQTVIEGVPDQFGTRIERLGGFDSLGSHDGVLTDRQREVVEAAIDVGYFDVPRTGSQEDVAARVGCSASTVAEHLRKAEAKVLRSKYE